MYRVVGQWLDSHDSEHADLQEALNVAADLSEAHRDAVFTVTGQGFTGQVFQPSAEKVEAE